MPSKASHLCVVRENTATIEWIRKAPNPMPQWVVTVAFYKALHIVEAVFAADKYSPIRHADDHAQRNEVLRRENRYGNITVRCGTIHSLPDIFKEILIPTRTAVLQTT